MPRFPGTFPAGAEETAEFLILALLPFRCGHDRTCELVDTRTGRRYAASWATEGRCGVTIVTEAEWLQCTDPTLMLKFHQGNASDRKLRLFAVACCRRIWDLLDDERSRLAVETSAKYVEGLVGPGELYRSHLRAQQVEEEFWPRIQEGTDNIPNSPAQEAAASTAADPLQAFRVASLTSTARVWAGRMVLEEMQAAKERENGSLCHLLRDLFGNPLRPAALNHKEWAAEAVALAETIYDHCSFERLLELAQVLQATGCTNSDILSHCRSSGEHVRGCWVIDLLLGKE